MLQSRRPDVERTTKLILLGWAYVAAVFEVWMLRSWSLLPAIAAGVGVAAFICAAIDRRAIAIVLTVTYLFPALIKLFHGNYHAHFAILWLVALLGAIAPDASRTSWHIPTPWRRALVCWALVVAVAVPIVALREIDFNWLLLVEPRMPSSILRGAPGLVVEWVLHVALTLVVGILWFDWLFGAAGQIDFHKVIGAPLLLSFLVMAGVSLYQLFGDVTFLNETVFGELRRASGTLFDGNAFGTISAMWVGGVMLWAQPLRRLRGPALAVAITVAWLAVWASGSRTAFTAAAIVMVFGVAALYAARGKIDRRMAIRTGIPAIAVAVALSLVLANANLEVVGPLRRIQAIAPSRSAESVRKFLIDMLWIRDNYGLAANEMIRQFPWFGVGVGIFQSLATDFSSQGPLIPDNAQNWYRHQFAELGLIGSVPWIVWVGSFAVFLLRRGKPDTAAAWIGRGVLIAFALISMFGVPGQDVSVSFTFWTMAFWYVLLAGEPQPTIWFNLFRSWAAVAVVLVLFTAGTLVAATGNLRVPVRNQHLGHQYSYGFYGPEPDGAGGEVRWARKRAVIVLEAPKPWMKLTVSVNHADIMRRPVAVKVWRDREIVLDTQLATTEPVTRYITLSRDEKFVFIETWVNRFVRPSDYGLGDNRELGLLVKWTFVDSAPDHLTSPTKP